METDANSASSSSRVLAPGGSMLGPVRAAAGCCGGGGGGGGGDVSVENPGSRSSSDNCRMVANAVCARMNEIQRGGKQITKLQIYIYINIYMQGAAEKTAETYLHLFGFWR